MTDQKTAAALEQRIQAACDSFALYSGPATPNSLLRKGELDALLELAEELFDIDRREDREDRLRLVLATLRGLIAPPQPRRTIQFTTMATLIVDDDGEVVEAAVETPSAPGQWILGLGIHTNRPDGFTQKDLDAIGAQEWPHPTWES